MSIRYVGRESHFHGKSLYEIARSLKCLGVGRMVVRAKFNKQYAEPSYYRLTSVVPAMNAAGYSKGVAYGEKVFRGKNYGVCRIDAGHKHDWRLVPKDQEQTLLEAYQKLQGGQSADTTVPSIVRIPPLMEIIFKDEMKADGIEFDELSFYSKIRIENSKYNNAKIESQKEMTHVLDTPETNKGLQSDKPEMG